VVGYCWLCSCKLRSGTGFGLVRGLDNARFVLVEWEEGKVLVYFVDWILLFV
jgi:hypothetical protein